MSAKRPAPRVRSDRAPSAPVRGGRNHALNRAVFVIAGKAWCGLDEREVYDAMVWACTHNGLIADDGLAAFDATFKSGWDAGILKPLPGPRERYPDSDIIIDLKPKATAA